MRLEGLYTAMVTPFSEGRLDERGFRANLSFQIESGVDGVVVLSTTGEEPTLTDEERRYLIETTVERARSHVQILVGTGANSTRATIANTELAKEMGADAALVVAPYYNRPTQKGLFEHFEAISKAVDLPLVVYNVPARTGTNIDPLTMREIAMLPNVVGIKEASGSIAQIQDTIHHLQEEGADCTVLSGDDPLTFSLMALGGHGVISILSNLAPVQVREMIEALDRDDWEEARQHHYRLLPLAKAMFFETNPIPIKAAMELCHKAAGKPRLPLTELSQPHRDSLIRLLEQVELMPAGARV